jgi:hypothetical protein
VNNTFIRPGQFQRYLSDPRCVSVLYSHSLRQESKEIAQLQWQWAEAVNKLPGQQCYVGRAEDWWAVGVIAHIMASGILHQPPSVYQEGPIFPHGLSYLKIAFSLLSHDPDKRIRAALEWFAKEPYSYSSPFTIKEIDDATGAMTILRTGFGGVEYRYRLQPGKQIVKLYGDGDLEPRKNAARLMWQLTTLAYAAVGSELANVDWDRLRAPPSGHGHPVAAAPVPVPGSFRYPRAQAHFRR